MFISTRPQVSLNQPTQPSQPAPAPAPQPPAAEPKDEVFSWNPQDRRVFEASEKTIANVTSNNGTVSVPKATLNANLEKVDGKYVYGHDDPRQSAAVSFCAVANAINTFQGAYGDFNWAFGAPQLQINPDAGEMFNAFYQRGSGSLNFFHAADPVVGQAVMSGHSGEIASHECGHAMLDAVHPEYLETWSTDPGAFHEAFGDCMAIMVNLQDERTLDRLVVQTGGDLSKPNCLALMAEELGEGINNSKGKNVTGGDSIRDANNTFTWADPDTLPHGGDSTHLGNEVHSFSRLWTGAFFDVLKGIVAENIAAGQTPKDAMRNAGAEMLTSTANMLHDGPQGDFTYKDMANAWVASETKHGGKHADLIKTVMTNRKIIDGSKPAEVPAEFAGAPLQRLSVTLNGDGFGQYAGAQVEVPVSAHKAFTSGAQIREKTESQLQNLINDGRIRWTEPNGQSSNAVFDAKGRPYIGAVEWDNGQMRIKRLPNAD